MVLAVLGNTDEVLGMSSTGYGRSPGTLWQLSVCGDALQEAWGVSAWLGFGDLIMKKKGWGAYERGGCGCLNKNGPLGSYI